MKKLIYIIVLLVTPLLFLSLIVTGCGGDVQNETITTSDVPLRLEQAGTWNYSFFPGMEEFTEYYDPEGGLYETITITTAEINGADYLVLSFDPLSGPGHNSRLFIFDIEDPVSPRLISSIAHPDQERKAYLVRDVSIRDDILYAGLFGDKGLWMVDISNPASPVDLGIAPVETNMNILVSGNYLYSSGQLYNGIIICDISDVSNVKEIKRLDIPTRSCQLAINDNLLFLGIERTLIIYDISSPDKPKKLSDCELSLSGNLSIDNPDPYTMNWSNMARINDVQASGDYVYIGFGAGKVRVIDVSNPSSPRETTPINLEGFAISLTLKGDLLYMTKSDYEGKKIQLAVLDISETENPKLVDSVTTESDFILGGVTFAYCWARPQVVDDFIFVSGMRYLDIFELR
jgi:hypothetical protein